MSPCTDAKNAFSAPHNTLLPCFIESKTTSSEDTPLLYVIPRIGDAQLNQDRLPVPMLLESSNVQAGKTVRCRTAGQCKWCYLGCEDMEPQRSVAHSAPCVTMGRGLSHPAAWAGGWLWKMPGWLCSLGLIEIAVVWEDAFLCSLSFLSPSERLIFPTVNVAAL